MILKGAISQLSIRGCSRVHHPFKAKNVGDTSDKMNSIDTFKSTFPNCFF